MHKYSSTFFDQIVQKCNQIKRENPNEIQYSLAILELVNSSIKELYDWLIEFKFNKVEEEIEFFKYQKPRIISKLIIYSTIIDIESKAPSGNKTKQKYYAKELNKILKKSSINTIFYQYYRANATHNDAKYFTRNRGKNLRYYESHIINYDIRCSTSHDYYVAQIIANDDLAMYYEKKIKALTTNNNFDKQLPILNWTGNKVDLTELIYALHTKKVINHGNVDIKELAIFFGIVFNVKLEDNIYRWYSDIKIENYLEQSFWKRLQKF